jgi:hypothetical protein
MEVTAADTDIFDLEKDVVFADFGYRDFTDFYGILLLGVVDYCGDFSTGHGLGFRGENSFLGMDRFADHP